MPFLSVQLTVNLCIPFHKLLTLPGWIAAALSYLTGVQYQPCFLNMEVVHCSPAWQLVIIILIISALDFLYSVINLVFTVSCAGSPARYTISLLIQIVGLASALASYCHILAPFLDKAQHLGACGYVTILMSLINQSFAGPARILRMAWSCFDASLFLKTSPYSVVFTPLFSTILLSEPIQSLTMALYNNEAYEMRATGKGVNAVTN